MRKTEHPILIITIAAAAAALSGGRFCTVAGAVPAAGAYCPGVVHEDVAIGEPVPVMTHGVAIVTTGGSITAGAAVETDNQGRAVVLNEGVPLGRALDTSTGAGQEIRVKLS
jgi:hypothetical protein